MPTKPTPPEDRPSAERFVFQELAPARAICEKMAERAKAGAFDHAFEGMVRAFARILAAHRGGVYMSVARDLDEAGGSYETSAALAGTKSRTISDAGAARGCREAAAAIRTEARSLAEFLNLNPDLDDSFLDKPQRDLGKQDDPQRPSH